MKKVYVIQEIPGNLLNGEIFLMPLKPKVKLLAAENPCSTKFKGERDANTPYVFYPRQKNREVDNLLRCLNIKAKRQKYITPLPNLKFSALPCMVMRTIFGIRAIEILIS